MGDSPRQQRSVALGRRAGLAGLGTALIAALALMPTVAAADGGELKAKITRNAQGIPTIEAENWK